jgi:CRISPR-associated protein Cmr1
MSQMTTRTFQVRFHTPAFLGNAEQTGQWRTPPFKALLRQWWRVAYAASQGFQPDVDQMRQDEGVLFGAAADGAGNRSLVRFRLDRWDIGKLHGWDGLEANKVHHPEAEKARFKVGPHAYLGFGPLDGRGGTKFTKKDNAAIQAGESAQLSIAFPEQHATHLDQALWHMDRYGTLGGRSRNGWGSLSLLPPPPGEGLGEGALSFRPWQDCLQLDWPHAIGRDDQGPLVWQTKPHNDWQSLMRTLAEIKIGMRTDLSINTKTPDKRHWLSYPVTHHNVSAWDNEAKKRKLGNRLPNSLRYKARLDSAGKLRGLIFHVPCLPPPQFNPQPHRQAIEHVWRQVHAYLDNQKPLLARIAG